MDVSIPVGVEHAVVSVPLPYPSQSSVIEGGLQVWDESFSVLDLEHRSNKSAVRWVGTRSQLDGTRLVVFELGSGKYKFEAH